jgi:hypothetical protein
MMTKKTRRKIDAALKAKIALEAMREQVSRNSETGDRSACFAERYGQPVRETVRHKNSC